MYNGLAIRCTGTPASEKSLDLLGFPEESPCENNENKAGLCVHTHHKIHHSGCPRNENQERTAEASHDVGWLSYCRALHSTLTAQKFMLSRHSD
jgi:hypothetical protein